MLLTGHRLEFYYPYLFIYLLLHLRMWFCDVTKENIGDGTLASQMLHIRVVQMLGWAIHGSHFYSEALIQCKSLFLGGIPPA